MPPSMSMHSACSASQSWSAAVATRRAGTVRHPTGRTRPTECVREMERARARTSSARGRGRATSTSASRPRETRGAAEEQTRGALRLGEEACGDRVEVQCRQCQLGARHVACGIHPASRFARLLDRNTPRRARRRPCLPSSRPPRFSRRASRTDAAASPRARASSSAPPRPRPRPPRRPPPSDDVVSGHKPRVAVVGAGWGGFGAAKALCEAGCDVTLLDGIPDPTGATPSLTPTGKPFEYGTRGFWKDYPNIEAMLAELGVDESDVFSDFTPSSFFSPDGLEATAPVFSSSDYLQLPSPLGQVFATFDNFKRLPLEDRASMAGLLYAMLDLGRDDATFRAYDRMTAHDLFIRMGLSKRLVDDFIRPTLLVGLFKPPEELSAAVTMELLYYYALAHQDSFDVRWIARGTVQSALVRPLAAHLTEKHHLTVLGGCRVEKITVDETTGRATGVSYATRGGERDVLEDVDAVVLALGAKGMRGVVASSPALARRAPELSRAASLGGIDVVTTRIWLDRYVAVEHPANVLSRFDGLRGAGGTFFMLDQLQKDHEVELWGGEEPKGSVLACDFYNGGAVACLSDEDIVALLLDELLPAAVPGFAGARALDAHVVRCPGAVTWFSRGRSNRDRRWRRPCRTWCAPGIGCEWAIANTARRVCARSARTSADWRRATRCFAGGNSRGGRGERRPGGMGPHPVLPVRADEMQVVLGRAANKAVMDALAPFGLDSPWVR